MARSRTGINDLPDSLLCLILSRVPLDQAIRCSVISKRWRFLWRYLPNLRFSEEIFYSSARLFEIQNIIDGILKWHSVPLELFQFYGLISFVVSRAKINEWIHHAALKDVRKISLQFHREVEVPNSVFFCTKLRYLCLRNFRLENMPGSCGGFACLETLYLLYIKLNDKTLELMLQLCPVLKVLVVGNCHGVQRVKVCSGSLIFLHLDFPSSSNGIRAITASCPRLVSLAIKVPYHVEKMKFELPACLHLSTTAAQLDPFTTLKSLRKMTILSVIYQGDVSCLHKFPDLNQICIDNAKYRARLS
ncbi:hypothetical protein SUGI_0346450 [Cryptomeria japonica]|uniref:F-box/FBD/LRR-repeat protein At1g13570-like n=1 Tax=Cryptomeria japonica TaxID=3369 RepID=UPI002408BCAF|nr:F-box/FBD/LRR-repeat protein At1g13570-like [Cryptomeria japonica]GLJ19262.1 hypothetical protein SUGI_0346450 [Cryptomeria japonica]